MHSSLRALAALTFVLACLSGCNCSPNKCSNCTGCCDESGVCQGGFLPERCGTAGEMCVACAVGQSCTAGHCGILSTGGGGGGNGSTGGGTGTGGGIGTGGGGGGNVNGFCANYAAAYCDYGIRCGLFASQGKADCETFIDQALCEPELDGVKQGYDVFNGTTAQACVDSFSTAPCGNNDPTGTGPCSQPFTSAASNTGQGCLSSGDCLSADDGCGGASACNRTCTVAGGLGEPCPKSTVCSNGLRCDSVTNTCANPHNLGETCRPYGFGECTADARCDDVSSTCVALPTTGPCYQYTCASSAYCDATAAACMPRKTDGQTCGYDQCVTGFWCDFSTSTCKAQTGQGASCQAYYGSCQGGLTCLNNTCQPPLQQGVACQLYSDCATGLSCDAVLKTCGEYQSVAAGQACTADTLSCAYPSKCRGLVLNPDGGVGTEGTCAASMVGDSCTSTFGDCPLQSYCALDGGSGLCIGATHSSPCYEDSDCLPGDFCNGSTCQGQLSQGQPCDPGSSTECATPLQCVSNASDGGSCGTLGGPNAPCAGDNACLFPYSCINGSCTAAGHQGEPCFGGYICLDGLCQADAGVLGSCTGQKAADGQPCEFGTECQSGRCMNYSVCVSTCP